MTCLCGVIALLSAAKAQSIPPDSIQAPVLPFAVVAPFEEVMVVSDITEALAQGSGCTPGEVIARCREGIVYALVDGGSTHFSSTPLMHGNRQPLLSKVYYSVSRAYQSIPALHFPSGADSAYHSLLTRQELANHRFLDRMEKYLTANISDTTLFSTLKETFRFDYLVLLNQMDFIQTDDPLTKLPGGGERWCRVHYTIYDAAGTFVTGGVARSSFPKETNDMNTIVTTVFPKCADQIWRSLWLVRNFQ